MMNDSNQQNKPSEDLEYHDDRGTQGLDRRFAFEADINCLPMYVKRMLDRLALKIGRGQWLAMTDQDRVSIGQLSTKSEEDCERAKRIVREILHRYGTEPTPLPQSVERFADPPVEVPAEVIESARELGVALTQEKWSSLNTDQRYALTKLIDSGKKNKRKRALREFLAAQID
jgi:hypothetical protein